MLLIAKNLEVTYQRVILVLRGVSVEIQHNNIVTLLGANGSGKTTFLRALSGLLKTQDGEIREGNIEFMGKRIDNMAPENIVRLGISQVMENRRIFENLTVEENLKVGAYIHSSGRQINIDIGKIYEYFPKLRLIRNKIAGYVSGGEQQMVVVGRALMSRPKLMLLDEPSLGLAPLLVSQIFEIIKKINILDKVSVILVEQNANAALEIADFGYVMENGRIVLEGPVEKIKENEDIKEFYMGLSEVGKQKSYRDVKHYKRRKRWLS
jgi:branched-chain amino acid transport system ATP-binding protein